VTSPDDLTPEPGAEATPEEQPQETVAPPSGEGRHRRPGGQPEAHPDESGSFGDEPNQAPVETPVDTDLSASDELILAQTELAERTLDLQRLQAEFLNYKRRVERDRELVQQNAVYSVLSGMLPVLDDIDKMVKDAEAYAEEDRKRRESVETRNQADSLVYSTEKFLSENDEKLPEDVKTEVQSDVDALKKLLEDEGTENDTFTAAITKLGESSQKMGAAIYAASEAEAAASAGAESGAPTDGDDDVVDAEIVDEDRAGTEGQNGESK
jgi:molecular chaperone GrpE (heat shock protein)